MVFTEGGFSGFRPLGLLLAILSIAITLAVVVIVVWFTESERRIPVQYAKRQVGRKMYGGQTSHLPLKMNMAGVMPIIFASSIASIPATIASFFPKVKWLQSVTEIFNYNSILYILVFLLLIVGFSYFYILISFDPVEVANNIQQQGGSIAGRRPGKPTYKYLKKVLNRVTLIGAFFLGFIACFPMLINMVASFCNYTALQNFAFSGSSLLIIIGVIQEVERSLESQIAVRNYGSNRQTRGLFEGGRRSKKAKATETADDKTSSN
jgi:preprotein translocase subunit SecY